MWLHPEIRTLPDIVTHWARRVPDRTALVAGPAELTWADLDRETTSAARSISGTSPEGSPVCFIGKNVPEFWTVWFGAGRAARPFAPLNWRCTVPELAELLDDARPGVLVATAEYADVISAAIESSGTDPELVVFTSAADGGTGLSEWYAASSQSEPVHHARPEDTALIAYTSGTTGQPKGVLVSHEAFDLSHLSDELEPSIAWSSDDVLLMVMPNFHLAGSWVSLPALYHGGTVAMVAAFEPQSFLRAVEAHRPTVTCLVPTAIQVLVDAQRATGADISSLRTLVYAGSPIASRTVDEALDVLGCDLRQFYGTTETYIISILRPDDHRSDDLGLRGSCGAPVPLVSMRVVDPAGHDLPDGEVGQVLVRSPITMSGYHGKPEETSAAVRDGWYWTGDLGYRGESGNYYLVDRAKDMVVTGGENVYSVEVERALQRHPAVAMVAVVGLPDERWGEAVTAYVVPAPDAGSDDLAESLVTHCRELIAAYKVPKAIHVVDALPMTPMGKVRKTDLRKQARA